MFELVRFCVSDRSVSCLSCSSCTHSVQDAHGTGLELQIQCQQFRTCLSHHYLHITRPWVVCLPPLLGVLVPLNHYTRYEILSLEASAWMHEKQHHPPRRAKAATAKSVALTYLNPDACRAVHMPLHCWKQAGQLEHQHLHHTYSCFQSQNAFFSSGISALHCKSTLRTSGDSKYASLHCGDVLEHVDIEHTTAASEHVRQSPEEEPKKNGVRHEHERKSNMMG